MPSAEDSGGVSRDLCICACGDQESAPTYGFRCGVAFACNQAHPSVGRISNVHVLTRTRLKSPPDPPSTQFYSQELGEMARSSLGVGCGLGSPRVAKSGGEYALAGLDVAVDVVARSGQVLVPGKVGDAAQVRCD